jgi:hypothetical protein
VIRSTATPNAAAAIHWMCMLNSRFSHCPRCIAMIGKKASALLVYPRSRRAPTIIAAAETTCTVALKKAPARKSPVGLTTAR